MNKRILVIDDESSVLEDYRTILSPPQENLEKLKEKEALEADLFGEVPVREYDAQEQYEVTTALQGREGFEQVKRFRDAGTPFALAFVDVRMPPGWDGIQTAKRIREIDSEIEIVIVTAYSDRDRREIVKKVGMPERLLYIKKPFDPDEIRQLALALTRKWDLERKAERHREYLKRLISSVRRLKTLSISTVRDVLTAILDEVLRFSDAKNGFIARFEDEMTVEIVSGEMDFAQIYQLMGEISDKLAEIDTIAWINGTLVFPLKNGCGNLFVLVSDIRPPMTDERFNLLKLLMETSLEVLDSVRKQEQCLKNERIATIGQIAAGIVHEINNPLTAILGFTDICMYQGNKLKCFFEEYQKAIQTGAQDSPIAHQLMELHCRYQPENLLKSMLESYAFMRDGMDRVRGLMVNIRSFTRAGDRVRLELRDVSEAMEDTLMLAHNALKYGVTICKEWDSPLMAWCDINALKQMFLNLILNAVQAMDGSGELRISGKREKEHILISIKDSGPGIPESLRNRIFEPFFTTKTDGTGLGLSIVKGIVEKHKGKIWVESEVGHGTVFHIELPAEDIHP